MTTIVALDRFRKPKPPQSPQPQPSLGLLRVELFLTGGAWLSIKPDRYLLRAVECVDSWVKMEGEYEDLEDVKALLEFCRKAAKARGLTFEFCNHTGKPDADYGVI